ncbi:hypothetical protein K432DRAFT_308112 [Lepidopterella palustris CBS 459.81]|uniref:ABM domain-containing protein n=1 Tax=Lepidopterella palustris CBS 459.81 TaxID=1314670 RepID=A0A8E2E1R9_9PEZI|nr:hypothetical protein K432DRAFT_308112 [Lepidopterella palustris CBS 459.81]
MTSTVVIGHLTTAGKEARQKVCSGSSISKYSREQEPGVTRYAVSIPRDPQDEKSVYVIEEYANQETLDAHIWSFAVIHMMKLLLSDGSVFGEAPDVYTMEPVFSFSRPEILKASDPYIVVASLDYEEGTRAKAFDGWKRIVSESQKNEPGTLGYTILKDKDHENTIWTVEVYETEKYLRDVHAKSTVVTDDKTKYSDIKTNLDFAFLKIVAGYLHKEKQLSNM